MKGANIETAGSGSFWKQAHHFALTETTLHLLGDRPDGVAIAPFDKDRTGSRHQPSNHRPAPDLALGDKGCGTDAVEHNNVYPGNMIHNPRPETRRAGKEGFRTE